MTIGEFIGAVIITTIIGFLGYCIVWDFQRFSRVDEARTPEEISRACDEYSVASIKNLPAKCFTHFNIAAQ